MNVTRHGPSTSASRFSEQGQNMILFALLLVPMVMILALAVDLGLAYAERRQAQTVADFGAEGGAKVIAKHVSLKDYTGVDAEVQTAILEIANNSSGGYGAFTLGTCPTSGSGPVIQGAYVDAVGTEVGVVGGGDLTNARGVRLQACKSLDTNFARVAGIDTMPVSVTATVVTQAITKIDPGYGGFGPFAVWGGQSADCTGPFGCLDIGKEVIYRANQWGDCPPKGPVLPADVCGAGLAWDVDSGNFKGDIDHGTGVIDSSTKVYTTNGGNAFGMYQDMLYEHWVSGQPVIMPIVAGGRYKGSNIELDIIGFVSVVLKTEPKTGKHEYVGTITVMPVNPDPNIISDGTETEVPGSRVLKYLQ